MTIIIMFEEYFTIRFTATLAIINRYTFETQRINSSSFKTVTLDAMNDGNEILKRSIRIRSVSTNGRHKPMVINHFCYFCLNYYYIIIFLRYFFLFAGPGPFRQHRHKPITMPQIPIWLLWDEICRMLQ